jgi:hypothetical protein
MSILDKEGRLFGRVNLLDAVFVIVVLCLLGVVLVTRLLPNRPRQTVRGMDEPEPAVAKIIIPRGNEWLAGHIHPGDETRNVEDLSARILSVGKEAVPGSGTQMIVTVWLRTRRNPEGLLLFGQRALRPGGSFELCTHDYVLSGTVYSLQPAAVGPPQ